ncbi:MAG: hypothetical protein WCX88_03735 [Patescibacteria group bacterium]
MTSSTDDDGFLVFWLFLLILAMGSMTFETSVSEEPKQRTVYTQRGIYTGEVRRLGGGLFDKIDAKGEDVWIEIATPKDIRTYSITLVDSIR